MPLCHGGSKFYYSISLKICQVVNVYKNSGDGVRKFVQIAY